MFFPEVFTAVGEAVNSEEQKQQEHDHVLQFALVDAGCRAESSGHSDACPWHCMSSASQGGCVPCGDFDRISSKTDFFSKAFLPQEYYFSELDAANSVKLKEYLKVTLHCYSKKT